MSDEQHPEIVDIGLPATHPLSYATLIEIDSGQLVNIHDGAARSMAREVLILRANNAALLKEITDLRGEVGFAATME